MLTMGGDGENLTQLEIAWLMIGCAADELSAAAERPAAMRDMGTVRQALEDLCSARAVLL